MIQNEVGFEIQWEYVLILGGILIILVAFVYVLYNTTNSVRDAVHKNFGPGSNVVQAAPSSDKQAKPGSASIGRILSPFPGS
jgi:hypothetical protein